MTASVSTEIEQVLARLAPEARRRRQSALLRPLSYSLIVISLLGLTVMAVRVSTSTLRDFTIVAVSLLLNVIVALLDRAGYTTLAAYLFSMMTNLGILLIVALNLFQVENLALGLMFACQLALSVILAGMLLGTAYAFIFAGVNVLTCLALFYRYFATVDDSTYLTPLNGTASAGVPIAGFLILIAVITGLYQRALGKADERLETARKRIIQDEIIRRDLAIARELQLRLFPPPPLTNPGLQIATRSAPARETSGDFYDFVELDDGLLGIVVADVTGKSIAAALMMALARVTIRSEARRHASPAEVLRAANETICRDHTARQMITAFYGVLDTTALSLRFASAGHPYPILRRGAQVQEVELGGLPLGGRPDSRYGEATVQLEPGDQLFLLSDGLIEERNARRQMFGYNLLLPAISSTDPLDPEEALDQLWQTVASFRGDAEQSDDITCVVVQAVPLAEARPRQAGATVQDLTGLDRPHRS